MFTENTLLKKFSYREMVESLEAAMAEKFADFPPEQMRFHQAISALEKDDVPSTQEAVEAIYRQIGSGLLFSFFLGLTANFDHFIDPIGRTFMDVDAEIYLREEVAKQLPDYQKAQHVKRRFYAVLSPAQQDLYKDVIAYISYLETVGPKWAHYYGYTTGNQLFQHIIPGYCPDTRLTAQYRNMLENYFGVSF